jgi:hypothetical protein
MGRRDKHSLGACRSKEGMEPQGACLRPIIKAPVAAAAGYEDREIKYQRAGDDPYGT